MERITKNFSSEMSFLRNEVTLLRESNINLMRMIADQTLHNGQYKANMTENPSVSRSSNLLKFPSENLTNINSQASNSKQLLSSNPLSISSRETKSSQTLKPAVNKPKMQSSGQMSGQCFQSVNQMSSMQHYGNLQRGIMDIINLTSSKNVLGAVKSDNHPVIKQTNLSGGLNTNDVNDGFKKPISVDSSKDLQEECYKGRIRCEIIAA